MNPRQIQLIRSALYQIEPIADTAVSLFYARLFELDPAMRSMFPADLTVQGKKSMHLIKSDVSLLDRPHALVSAAEALGKRHAADGLQDEHYAAVGAALIWTLERVLGTGFAPDVKSAWLTFYLLIANTMKAAVARCNGALQFDEPSSPATQAAGTTQTGEN